MLNVILGAALALIGGDLFRLLEARARRDRKDLFVRLGRWGEEEWSRADLAAGERAAASRDDFVD